MSAATLGRFVGAVEQTANFLFGLSQTAGAERALETFAFEPSVRPYRALAIELSRPYGFARRLVSPIGGELVFNEAHKT